MRVITETENFCEYVRDHVETFRAIPCEFEQEDGQVFNADECWESAKKLGLLRLLDNPFGKY